MTRTFDNKRQVRPLHLIHVDEAFKDWWEGKLNIYLANSKGERKKVPVRFVAPERWAIAREEGWRNADGILELPIITISRTSESGGTEPGLQRIFSDTKQDHTYYKKIDPKSSLVKELVEDRTKEIDPTLPIYEVYTHKAPDHFVLTYEVQVWTTYVDEMNEIIEKLGQELDYRSVKSLTFKTKDGYSFRAFQEDSISDDSNLTDFTGKERVVRKSFTFKVPAYIMPQSDQRRDTFKRFWSQTKLVFKEETALTNEALDKLLKK